MMKTMQLPSLLSIFNTTTMHSNTAISFFGYLRHSYFKFINFLRMGSKSNDTYNYYWLNSKKDNENRRCYGLKLVMSCILLLFEEATTIKSCYKSHNFGLDSE